eukprot:Skav204483  [mRNA]  locus=scaffold535:39308:46062:+ [translate_table: standard]
MARQGAWRWSPGVAAELASKWPDSVLLMGRRKAFLEEAVELLAKEKINATCRCGVVGTPLGVMEIDTLGTFNMCRASFEALKASQFGGAVTLGGRTSITATLHYTATWYQTAPVAAKAGELYYADMAKAAIDAMTRALCSSAAWKPPCAAGNLALEWGEFGIRCNCVAPGPIAETPGLEKLSYITGQTIPVDGGEWFGKKPMMPRELVSGRQVKHRLGVAPVAVGFGRVATCERT